MWVLQLRTISWGPRWEATNKPFSDSDSAVYATNPWIFSISVFQHANELGRRSSWP